MAQRNAVAEVRDALKAYTTRELATRVGCAESTLRRKLKKWRIENGPWVVSEITSRLVASPPDSSLSRSLPKKTEPLPPADTTLAAPTLDQLEDSIRRTTDKDEAERLSKQVRSLKAMQEVREREGQTIDSGKARGEIEAAFTFFQTTLMGWPKTVAGSLVGLPAIELETILEGRFTEILAELRRGLERAITSESQAVQRDGARANSSDSPSAEPMG